MSSTTARFFSLLWSPFPVLHSRPPNPFISVATCRSRLFVSQAFSSSRRSSVTTRNYLLILPSSLSPLTAKCSSRQINFNAQPQNLGDDNLTGPITPSSAPPFNGGRALLPWPEWSKFFGSLVSSGYFTEGQADLDWDELVDSRGFSDDFIRAAKACLAFAHAHQDLIWSLPRKDVEVLVECISPFIFRDGVDSYRRMKSFLAGHTDPSDKPSTVDLMRYILSYVNKILSPSEVHNMEIVDLSVGKLFIGFVENKGKPFGSIPSESTGSNRPTPGSVGKNIERKRGDWICPRCSFMNFAKNPNCLECKESRPKSVLTGSEWECPQCDFRNYGKNKVCMRCDCKNPGVTNPVGGFSHIDNSNSGSNNNILSGDEKKKVQSWFTKLSQLESTSDANSKSTGEKFPGIRPLLEEVGELATGSQYKMKSGFERFSGTNPLHERSDKGNVNAKVTQRLDEIVGDSVGGFGSTEGRTGNSVGHNVGIDGQSQSQAPISSSIYGNTKEEVYHEKGDRQGGQSADDDFSDTMPMRKGENRIVVSKRKDRSLASPLYKRRTATEQSGNNYVPFVPFPPDYFTRDKQPVEGSSPPPPVTQDNIKPSRNGNAENYGNNFNSGTGHQKSDSFTRNQGQPPANQQANTVGWHYRGFGDVTDRTGTSAPPLQNNLNQMQNFVSAQQKNPQGASDSSHRTRYPNEANLSDGSLTQSTHTQSVVEPLWKGRSLEGSAVKEADPLDMSEEAKAQRFFKRVAQIKNIKELSEIPDEDFPSIMPMRKGVNRFVISKRKTPLERRLAQSQYRRNQPPVTTDPTKQKNEQGEN